MYSLGDQDTAGGYAGTGKDVLSTLSKSSHPDGFMVRKSVIWSNYIFIYLLKCTTHTGKDWERRAARSEPIWSPVRVLWEKSRDLTGVCVLSELSLARPHHAKGKHDMLLKDISILHEIIERLCFFLQTQRKHVHAGEVRTRLGPQTWVYTPITSLLLPFSRFFFFSTLVPVWLASLLPGLPRSFTPLMEIQYSCHGEYKLAHDCQDVFTLHLHSFYIFNANV